MNRREVGAADPIEELRDIILRPDRLGEKISPVIADALAAQVQASGEDVARAIAPIVGRAIRIQTQESREEIVDALYPVIGQVIRKALTEAIKELPRTIFRTG